MEESDRPRFALAIEAMAATFRAEATPALLLGYWMGLGDLPLDDVHTAIGKAIRECEFMPTVARLRILAKKPRADGAIFMPGAGWLTTFNDTPRRQIRGESKPETAGKILEASPALHPDRRLPREPGEDE